MKFLVLIFLVNIASASTELDVEKFNYARDLFLQNQFTRSLMSFDQLVVSNKETNNQKSDLNFKTQVGVAVSLYKLGDTEAAIGTLNSIKDTTKKQKENLSDLSDFISGKNTSQPFKNFDREIETLNQHQLKSPTLAGVMSALVPGSGQMYVGTYQSGALSFALNLITGLATAELFKKKMTYTGIASGTVFSFFYMGNIYSAVSSANAINEKNNSSENALIKKRYFPLLYLDFE